MVKSFYRKAIGFRLYNIDVSGGVLSQKSSWIWNSGKVIGEVHFARITQNCTLEKIVIEGISFLIEQFGTCTCTSQSCMAEGRGCSTIDDAKKIIIQKKLSK